jgi:hypothetical protein
MVNHRHQPEQNVEKNSWKKNGADEDCNGKAEKIAPQKY